MTTNAVTAFPVTADTEKSGKWLAVGMVLLALGASVPAWSQSFENQDASESIAGSEINVEDTNASERLDAVLASIGRLTEVADRVKVMSNADTIDVVYLSDTIGDEAPAELLEAVENNAERITALQEALQASAIFYNALASQRVNIPDVVAADILDGKDAIIYVRGVAPDESAPAPTGGQ